ncbi:MAG: HAD hydrolase-like protein [Verrucomicrobiae bacterium]|nr:HAD hydrolase-like protein [Verrucomicrobiae bacterium]
MKKEEDILQENMLAIFDIDGTICDTQDVEGRCYLRAFEETFGIRLATTDWTTFEEPTSSGIVRSLCAGCEDVEEKEIAFRDRFVALLEKERPDFPGDFCPLAGATEFIELLLADPTVTVAFATGGFDTEAAFKLRCCGIELGNFPHATSSDTPSRRDIIPLAASRAGTALTSAVYFGDAPWDNEVCRALGIPMIGIGRRIESLRKLGLEDVFRDFTEPQAIRNTMQNRAARGE